MQDIFNDPQFNKDLYGGVRDLDEPVGRLVYALYKDPTIETSWSCSGHIGNPCHDVGRVQEGFMGVNCSKLVYKCEEVHPFHIATHNLEDRFNFVKHSPHHEAGLWFTMDMDDISVPNPEYERIQKEVLALKAAGADPMMLAYNSMRHCWAKTQVPQELAQQRYQTILDIWQELTDQFAK